MVDFVWFFSAFSCILTVIVKNIFFNMGSSIYDVIQFLKKMTPLPHRHAFYNFVLCTIVTKSLPLPLRLWRHLWTIPMMKAYLSFHKKLQIRVILNWIWFHNQSLPLQTTYCLSLEQWFSTIVPWKFFKFVAKSLLVIKS